MVVLDRGGSSAAADLRRGMIRAIATTDAAPLLDLLVVVAIMEDLAITLRLRMAVSLTEGAATMAGAVTMAAAAGATSTEEDRRGAITMVDLRVAALLLTTATMLAGATVGVAIRAIARRRAVTMAGRRRRPIEDARRRAHTDALRHVRDHRRLVTTATQDTTAAPAAPRPLEVLVLRTRPCRAAPHLNRFRVASTGTPSPKSARST